MSSITVLSDSSLAVPLTQIVRMYAKESQVAVATSFTASGADQVSQIGEGASADVLITLRPSVIESLKQQGLADVYSQTIVARNRLALAAPADFTGEVDLTSSFAFARLLQQKNGSINLIIGNPAALSEGSFAMEALRRLDALQDVEPFLTYTRLRSYAIDEIARGSFGILFYTDAAQARTIRVLGLIPTDSYTPILYQAIVVAGENMDEARKFLDYLKGRQARAVLTQYGLVVD